MTETLLCPTQGVSHFFVQSICTVSTHSPIAYQLYQVADGLLEHHCPCVHRTLTLVNNGFKVLKSTDVLSLDVSKRSHEVLPVSKGQRA